MPKYTQEAIDQFKQQINERWIREINGNFRSCDENTATKELTTLPVGTYYLRPGPQTNDFFLSIRTKENVEHILFRLAGSSICRTDINGSYRDLNRFIAYSISPPLRSTPRREGNPVQEANIMAHDRFRLWGRDEVESALLKEAYEFYYYIRPSAGINFVISYKANGAIEHTLFRPACNAIEFIDQTGAVIGRVDQSSDIQSNRLYIIVAEASGLITENRDKKTQEERDAKMAKSLQEKRDAEMAKSLQDKEEREYRAQRQINDLKRINEEYEYGRAAARYIDRVPAANAADAINRGAAAAPAPAPNGFSFPKDSGKPSFGFMATFVTDKVTGVAVAAATPARAPAVAAGASSVAAVASVAPVASVALPPVATPAPMVASSVAAASAVTPAAAARINAAAAQTKAFTEAEIALITDYLNKHEAEFTQEQIKSMQCPITMDYMRDPVMVSDGRTYERNAIFTVLNARALSPISRVPLRRDFIVSNITIRDMIEAVLCKARRAATPVAASAAPGR